MPSLLASDTSSMCFSGTLELKATKRAPTTTLPAQSPSLRTGVARTDRCAFPRGAKLKADAAEPGRPPYRGRPARVNARAAFSSNQPCVIVEGFSTEELVFMGFKTPVVPPEGEHEHMNVVLIQAH